jgi:hypothetical protein
MAKAIELNLNSPEMFQEVPQTGESKRERPNFDEIGAQNIKWAGEKVKGLKDKIWGGLTSFGKRVMTSGREALSDAKQGAISGVEAVASVPARAEYAMNVTVPETAAKMAKAVDNKGMELHEGVVGLKDSVVEKFNDGIIQGGEFVEAKYQQVSTFAVESYKGLEGRAMSAYEKMSSRIEAASQRRKESRFKAAMLKMQEARREMLEAAAQAGIQL